MCRDRLDGTRAQILGVWSPWRLNFFTVALYICHPSGAQNSEVVSRFKKKLCFEISSETFSGAKKEG
jgi:hypothetical protein